MILFKTCLDVSRQLKERKKQTVTTRAAESPQEFIIDRVYALGTPIDMEDYAPNMNVIGNIINLYSKGDKVQPVLGFLQATNP